MELQFVVGDQEQHDVMFRFDPKWGRLSIAIDGAEVVNESRLFSLHTLTAYDFVVGDDEKHDVRIEKRRTRLLGGVQPQVVFAYVDGLRVAEGTT